MSSQTAIMAAEGWITCAKAAELAGVHISTITRLLDGADLVGQRAGRRRYVSLESMRNYYSGAAPILARIKEHARAAT